MDLDGKLAEIGKENKNIANETVKVLRSNFKNNSFDRNEIDTTCLKKVEKLNLYDALATLTSVITKIIFSRLAPHNPKTIILVGGGRKNKFLVRKLKEEFSCSVKLSEQVGWDGDSLEAQAFAYIAVRSLLGLNITYSQTTGVKNPISGGILHNLN